MPANHGSESQFEDTTIDRLKLLGYTYQHGGEIDRPLEEVVLKDALRAFLKEKYKDLSDETIDEIISRAASPVGVTLELRNKHFHEMLTRGFPHKYTRADGTDDHRHIYLVDWQDPKANDFRVVNQFPISGHQNDRRPDIIIFINGLPLVLFELKNPYEEEPNTYGAFNQIQHYKVDIPRLFEFNELVIVSDGGMVGAADDDKPHMSGSTLHGMWTSTWEWFAPWKSTNGRDVQPTTAGGMKTLIEGLFPKDRLLEYIRHFILFEVVNDKITKKGAKYHQFFGVRFAAQEALRATPPEGDRRIGVIWHTQGSGKSLSMVYFVGMLRHHPALENPTFVIQVDRNDLDQQLYDQFVAAEAHVGKVQHAEDVEELRSLLRTEGGEVVFSTIEKFRLDRDSGEREHPVLSERANIIVIADEAHRTQYGLTEGFAYHMRRALKNASFIGFTGTPIQLADADTEEVFGQVIHTYDIKQAQEDHATVKIFYEAHLIRLGIENDLLDEELEEITEKDEREVTARHITKWAAIAAAAGAKDRVEELATHLLDHFKKRCETTEGKAMVVCMSRENCVRLYDALTVLPGCPEVKIVMTGNISKDPKEWNEAGHITTKKQRDKIKERMKDPNDSLKIVIVRDMWLTGTDIPCLHTLYIDKPMHGHTLMQAIARVNRVFRDKPGGLIVDYIGVGDKLKEATKKYTASGGAGDPAPDINEEAVSIFQDNLERLRATLPAGNDYAVWRKLSNIEFEDLQIMCVAHVSETEERRTDYLSAEKQLSSAHSLVKHLPDCLMHADEVAFYQWIRKQVRKTLPGLDTDAKRDHAVRDLLDRSIETKGVVDIFKSMGIDKPDISILDDKFLEEFKSHQFENLRLKLLEKLVRDEISYRERSNLTKYKSFRTKLEETLQKYHNNAIQAAEVVRVMVEIRKDIDREEGRLRKLNLSSEEIAFYDAIAANVENLYDQNFLCDLVREVVQSVRKNLRRDWTKPHKEDVKAGVKTAVRMVLRKKGVKKEHFDALFSQIMEQATASFANWPMAA